MSPLLQERATPAAAQPLPLGEEQQQLEREDSDSDSSREDSDTDSSREESGATGLSVPVCVSSACGGGCGLRGAATSSVLCLAGLVCDVICD